MRGWNDMRAILGLWAVAGTLVGAFAPPGAILPKGRLPLARQAAARAPCGAAVMQRQGTAFEALRVHTEDGNEKLDKATAFAKLFEARRDGIIGSAALKSGVAKVIDAPPASQSWTQSLARATQLLKTETLDRFIGASAPPQAAEASASGAEGPADGEGQSLAVARGMVLIAAALYGTNFGSVKLLQGLVDPSLAAALRFSLAAAALSPMLRGLKREAALDGVAVGLLAAIGYIAQGISLETADASTAAFLCSLAVVVCPLLDAFTGVEVKASAWAAALLAVGGAGVLELGGGAAPCTGDLWALVQPLAFGAGFWKMEHAMRDHPGQGGALTAVQLGVVALCTVAWSVASPGSGTPPGELPDAAALTAALGQAPVQMALLWTGLVTTALTVWLETVALGRLPSAEVTVLFSTEPLWGTAFAAALLGEQVGANTLAGGGLIVAACLTRSLAGGEGVGRAVEGAKRGIGGFVQKFKGMV